MKTFEQLDKAQQFYAISIAYEKLKESVASGLIELPKMKEGTEVSNLLLFAEMAAEGSKYDDAGNPITEPTEVPYYFQGGCV